MAERGPVSVIVLAVEVDAGGGGLTFGVRRRA
jgi:hypothetical protein